MHIAKTFYEIFFNSNKRAHIEEFEKNDFI